MMLMILLLLLLLLMMTMVMVMVVVAFFNCGERLGAKGLALDGISSRDRGDGDDLLRSNQSRRQALELGGHLQVGAVGQCAAP